MRRISFVLCVFSILFFSAPINGEQITPKPKKVLTPEQQQRREQFDKYLAERHRLQDEARHAFEAEMAQANRPNGDCPEAQSTRAEVECLSKESEITAKNYKTFTSALRGLLAASPGSDSNDTPPAGPKGPALTPAQSSAEFDRVEQLWIEYRDALCTAAFHQGGGGTISPVLDMECRQSSTRNHMRDIHDAYGLLLRIR